MVEVLKTCSVGFICYKALYCLGKKDYADILLFILILYVGIMVMAGFATWYNDFMNSRFMEVIGKIF